jgi:hypothetical protein
MKNEHRFEVFVEHDDESTETIVIANTLDEAKEEAKKLKPKYPNKSLYIDEWIGDFDCGHEILFNY